MSDHTASPTDAFAAEVVAGLVERLTQATAVNCTADDEESRRRDEDFLRRLREAGL